MNGVLNSEAILFQSYKHAYIEAKCLKAQDNFSDLVPTFVTVESVSYPSRFFFPNLINPMTASNLSHTAVMHSSMEYFSKMTWSNTLGTGTACTTTVTFLIHNISAKGARSLLVGQTED